MEGNSELRLYLSTNRICEGQAIQINCSRDVIFNFGRKELHLFQLDSQSIDHLLSNPFSMINFSRLAVRLIYIIKHLLRYVSSILYCLFQFSYTEEIRIGDILETISHPLVYANLTLQRVSSKSSINVVGCSYDTFQLLALVHIDKCESIKWSGKNCFNAFKEV